MVIEAAQNTNQIFLLFNGMMGTSKSYSICAILTALGREDVIRRSFTAKAPILKRRLFLHSFFRCRLRRGLVPSWVSRKIRYRRVKTGVLVVIIDEYSMVSFDLLKN